MTRVAEPSPVDVVAPSARRRSRPALQVGVCVAGYLYGSLPFVYLLGRTRHVDLRARGSGNVGATNLWQVAGKGLAVAGWLADASKGLLPGVAARTLGCPRPVYELASVCGVAGQCWPLFLDLSGGRGMSAFVGAALAIDPLAWGVSLLPMIGGALMRAVSLLGRRARDDGRRLMTTRGKAVPLGCLLATTLFPVIYRVVDRTRTTTLVPSLLPAVIVLRRMTARAPDDAECGPAAHPVALLYRLLYDRNTST
ncbi:MAG TPA: glycerol-3-phosphate acyltransferase [Ktedonobacterales bacterium]